MVHIVEDQQKAQKALTPGQKENGKSLEEATLLKALPKSRLKVCKGENFKIHYLFSFMLYFFFHYSVL